MKLSKHFTLKEMTKSMTAQRRGIDNTPGPGEIKNLGDLCYEVLEPLHALGQACDLEIFGVPNIKTAYWLQNNVDFDQLIMEYFDPTDSAAGWIHISYHESDSNRKQVLTFDGKNTLQVFLK